MNKLIMLFLLLAFVLPSQPRRSVVTFEGDVVTPHTLPRWGFVCGVTDVHGSPREDSIITGSVVMGETLRLRELSRPTGEWVMIAPANWIPLKAVCW